MFELDDIGECYFAALIDGLRLINEKEKEKGLAFCSVKADADALVHYVRRKGQILVKIMQTQGHIRWTDEEKQQVADRFKELYPDAITIQDADLALAQEVLPTHRRYGVAAYSVKVALKTLLGMDPKPGRGRGGGPRRPLKNSKKNSKPALNGASPVVVQDDDPYVETLAKQIASATLVTAVEALRLAAEKLKNTSF